MAGRRGEQLEKNGNAVSRAEIGAAIAGGGWACWEEGAAAAAGARAAVDGCFVKVLLGPHESNLLFRLILICRRHWLLDG